MRKNKKLRKLFKDAKRGHAPSCYKLGILYELGKITGNSDMEEAACWIADAADQVYELAVEWFEDYAFDDDPKVQAYS